MVFPLTDVKLYELVRIRTVRAIFMEWSVLSYILYLVSYWLMCYILLACIITHPQLELDSVFDQPLLAQKIW